MYLQFTRASIVPLDFLPAVRYYSSEMPLLLTRDFQLRHLGVE
jgi:hypothetical protein